MDKAVNILTSLVLVALATTLVLPGRQTPAVIQRTFAGMSDLTRASMGQ